MIDKFDILNNMTNNNQIFDIYKFPNDKMEYIQEK